MATRNAFRDGTYIFQEEKKELIGLFDRAFQMDTTDTAALESIRVEIRDESVKKGKKGLYDREFLQNCINRLRNYPLGWNEQVERVVDLLSLMIELLKAFAIGSSSSDKSTKKHFRKEADKIKQEIIACIVAYLSVCWMIKVPMDERTEEDVRKVIEIMEQILEELKGKIHDAFFKDRKEEILGYFESKRKNVPFDLGKTKIVLFDKTIDSVARKKGISTFALEKIVFAHEFFHAYHAYHYSLAYGKDVPTSSYKEKVISESLASYAEYLYSSLRLNEDVYCGGGPNWAENWSTSGKSTMSNGIPIPVQWYFVMS